MITMTSYDPIEELNFDSQHTVRLRFMKGKATAEIITTMDGNVCGGDIIASFADLEIGLSVPADVETNRKHCIFAPAAEEEEEDSLYREVQAILLNQPGGEPIELSVDEAKHYLVGVEIVGFIEDAGEDE